MKKVSLTLLLALLIIAPVALTRAQGEDDFKAIVQVNSVFIHAEPSLQADRVASTFEDEELEVVGRNLDGTWFEVRRPGRLTNLGWLPVEYLDWDFYPEKLPLTNLTVGREGPEALEEDPGFAVYLFSGAVLRNTPLRTGGRVGPGVVPLFSVVPVLQRNLDGSWIQVNYRGYVGWISSFTGREMPNLMDLPLATGIPLPETVNIVIIPPEIQQGQIQRLRNFIEPRRTLASNLEGFWLMVQRGEIMPCNPPESITAYQYTASDVRELPELQRYAPQLQEAVDYLNAALAPLQACGVVNIRDVEAAHAAAINARLLFDVIADQVDSLEATIKQ